MSRELKLKVPDELYMRIEEVASELFNSPEGAAVWIINEYLVARKKRAIEDKVNRHLRTQTESGPMVIEPEEGRLLPPREEL